MKEGANRTLRTLRVVKDLISYYLLCGALLVGKIQLFSRVGRIKPGPSL